MTTIGEAQRDIAAPDWARRVDLNGLYVLSRIADEFVERVKTVPPRWHGGAITGGLLAPLSAAPADKGADEKLRRSRLADGFKATVFDHAVHRDLWTDANYVSLIDTFGRHESDARPGSALRREEALAEYLGAVYWTAFRFVGDACALAMGSRLTPTVGGVRAAQKLCRAVLELGKAGLWERDGFLELHTGAQSFLHANPDARATDRERYAKASKTQPALHAADAFEEKLRMLFPALAERTFRTTAANRFRAFVGRRNPHDSP